MKKKGSVYVNSNVSVKSPDSSFPVLLIDQATLPSLCWVTLWIPWLFACLQKVLLSYLNVPTAPQTDSVQFILEWAIRDNQ